MEQSSIVARFFCVVDSWPRELSCGVVFSAGPLFRADLCSGKRRRSSCLESGGTWLPISRSFRVKLMWKEECETWSFVLHQMHTTRMALTSYESNDTVANSRKNPLEAWPRLQKRYDPTTGGRKENLLRMIISLGRCCLLELQAVIERWESYVSRYEKKMKDKLDDEIKLAGLESLVPEKLEKHLILNSNRLRTFEDARLEIVTYVEAKFSLGIRDSKPSDTGSRGDTDPMDVDAVNSLSSGKGEGSSSPRVGCFKCGGAHFQRDCNARKNTGKQSSGKGKQSKSWSKSEQS